MGKNVHYEYITKKTSFNEKFTLTIHERHMDFFVVILVSQPPSRHMHTCQQQQGISLNVTSFSYPYLSSCTFNAFSLACYGHLPKKASM